MKQKWIDAYMDVAERFAQLSYAVRLKVGSVIVKDHRIISIGYNGVPAGWDNQCEDKIYMRPDDNREDQYPLSDHEGRYFLKTRPSVIHAEANAILKLARDGEMGRDATLFCTHAPCIDCAKMIYGAGISGVYYKHLYRDDHGIDFLKKCGVPVQKHDINSDQL